MKEDLAVSRRDLVGMVVVVGETVVDDEGRRREAEDEAGGGLSGGPESGDTRVADASLVSRRAAPSATSASPNFSKWANREVRNAGMLWALMEEKSYSWENLMERSSAWALASMAAVLRWICGWIGWGMS